MRIVFSLYTPVDGSAWIDFGVRVINNRVLVDGHIAYNDDVEFSQIQAILVDTGFNGYLSFPVDHWVADRAWISAEFGKGSSAALGGRKAKWDGAVSGFSIGGVVISPIPLTIMGDKTGWPARGSPLLGQLWFDVAEATWVDLAAETIAVSFEAHAVRDAIGDSPSLWVELPWRKAGSDSHRFVTIQVGEQSYDAVIDTGSVGELFLETSHPPSFVKKPWVRGRLVGARIGSLFRAMSTVPVFLGDTEIRDVEITWRSRPSELFADSSSGRPFALLGVPFLRKFPVLLDHRNDRAYFFIGDRVDLPRFPEPETKHITEPAARIDPSANDKPQMRSMFPGA